LTKNLSIVFLTQKIVTKSSDAEKNYSESRILIQGSKKAPDPGSGSTTLVGHSKLNIKWKNAGSDKPP
jgi:hypothetical protein